MDGDRGNVVENREEEGPDRVFISMSSFIFCLDWVVKHFCISDSLIFGIDELFGILKGGLRARKPRQSWHQDVEGKHCAYGAHII